MAGDGEDALTHGRVPATLAWRKEAEEQEAKAGRGWTEHLGVARARD